LFDISFMRSVPNLVFMAPKDENELRHMLYTGLKLNCPVALRYPRGKGVGVPLDGEFEELPLGRAEVISEGTDLCIIAVGNTVNPALRAAGELSGAGYSVGVINARFIKPIDKDAVLHAASASRRILTVEENALAGGFGSAVLEVLEEAGISNVPVKRIGVPDVYVMQGTQAQIRRRLGLDAEGILEAAEAFVSEKVLAE
ncbi:MAG: transketolase C-terminal domain-containing protein, partial [Nitrospirota bacterium]